MRVIINKGVDTDAELVRRFEKAVTDLNYTWRSITSFKTWVNKAAADGSKVEQVVSMERYELVAFIYAEPLRADFGLQSAWRSYSQMFIGPQVALTQEIFNGAKLSDELWGQVLYKMLTITDRIDNENLAALSTEG